MHASPLPLAGEGRVRVLGRWSETENKKALTSILSRKRERRK
jgi:hypothetical protein